jgi:phosphoribosyl 1,2-cyclic phosphodiesterase
LRIRFWGVRGTVPTPGQETVRYGGNTPCLDILTADNQQIIIDAGTGIRPFGRELMELHRRGLSATILLSHTHWDHIQGLPFFDPLIDRRNRFELYGPRRTNINLEETLAHQFLEPYLPFAYRSLGAHLRVNEVVAGETLSLGENTTITFGEMRHPGGCIGFRIEDAGAVFAYCSDTSHHGEELVPSVVALAQGADLVVHDAHFYTQAQASAFEDWGHSSWYQAALVAKAAEAGALALFHYAPSLNDENIDTIGRQAKLEFPGAFAAYEGQVIELESA